MLPQPGIARSVSARRHQTEVEEADVTSLAGARPPSGVGSQAPHGVPRNLVAQLKERVRRGVARREQPWLVGLPEPWAVGFVGDAVLDQRLGRREA